MEVWSCVGVRFPLLASSAPSFKPLPDAELPLHQFSAKKVISLSVVDDRGRSWKSRSPLGKDYGNKYDDEAIFVVEFLDDRASVSVVLNLDETRVCAYETSSLPAVSGIQATEAGFNWSELECVSSDKAIDFPNVYYLLLVLKDMLDRW
ncbi:hypothetical protein SDJN03_20475, partial [Cucurbita argyrosperma subsp. sororia]